MQLSDQDRDLLTRTVIGEAADQSDQGQSAVAHVILNRLQSGQYGKTASDVVLAPNQFESWNTGARRLLSYDTNSKAYQRAAQIVDTAASGEADDPTQGATHFLAPKLMAARGTASPKWAQGNSIAIGDHAFFAPGNPDYGKPLAFSENSTADLLGAYVKSPSSSAGNSGDSDLLGAWAKSAPVTASRPTSAAPAIAAPVVPKSTDAPETLPEVVNRWTAEHQGDGWTDAAARLGAGTVRGIGDVADTLAQGIAKVGATGANVLSDAGIISPDSAKAVQNWRAGINQNIAKDQAGFDTAAGDSALSATGRVAGNVLATAPLIEAGGTALAGAARGAPVVNAIAGRPILAAAASGAGVGAAANVLTSSTSDAPLGEQVKSGLETGAILGPLGYGAARLGAKLIGSGIDQETAQLAQAARNKYGINVGPGQISANPTVRFLDSVVSRLPFTGAGADSAAQQTALNRAVAGEMGATADRITPKVVNDTLRDLGKNYDDINSRIGTVNLDRQFLDELRNIRSNASYNLEPKIAARIDDHIQNVLSKVDRGTWTIDPKNYQYLTRKDGPLGKALSAGDSGIRQYAGDVKESLENLVWRNNPALKAEKDAADYKYFVAKSVQPLAEEAPTGNISPAKLLKAVDSSQTDVGELGRIGRRFLVEPPSSGTAERYMLMQHLPQLAIGATGIGGLGAATYFDPESWQRNALLGLGAVAAGRATGSALRSNILARGMIRSGLRPPSAAPSTVSNALNLALPATGAVIARRNALAPSP